jgi:PKHD-type hydroxylase
MRFKFYYWVYNKSLPHQFCDDVIKHCKTLQSQKALIGNKKHRKQSNKIRNSEVVFLSDYWIYKELHPYIRDANENAGWNFQWDYSEACQFTEYTKGQHYEWHYDMFKESYNNPKNENLHGKTRKLSIVVSLSDEKDYEGGDLEFYFGDFKFRGDEKNDFVIPKEMKNKGSIIVFPAFIYHRVTPVTKGTRYSLVNWNLGNPYV